MGNYDDIITLPHHTSRKHPQMTMQDRAAQFSPFSALTGYEDAIEETGRLTDRKIELEEYDTSVLDIKYRRLSELVFLHPEVTIIRFVPDGRKSGGAYETVSGLLKKMDVYTQTILLMDGTRIRFTDILSIESDSLLEI